MVESNEAHEELWELYNLGHTRYGKGAGDVSRDCVGVLGLN